MALGRRNKEKLGTSLKSVSFQRRDSWECGVTREGVHTFWTFWGDLEEDHTVVQVGRWERRMPRYLVVFCCG